MKWPYYFFIAVIVSHVSQAQQTGSISPSDNGQSNNSKSSNDFFVLPQTEYLFTNRQSGFVDDVQETPYIYKQGLWPSKGTVGIELNLFGELSHNDFLGKTFKEMKESETQFLTSLDLYETTYNPQTGTHSTLVHDYGFGGTAFFNIRVFYYLFDRLGLGIHFSHYSFDQNLTTWGSGTMASVIGSGVSIDYTVWHNDYLGVTITADIGHTEGSFTTASVLYNIRHNSDVNFPSSVDSLIVSAHESAKISGLQATLGTKFHYIFKSYIGASAGFHVFYLNSSLDKLLWTSSQKKFDTFSFVFNLGVDLYLWNN